MVGSAYFYMVYHGLRSPESAPLGKPKTIKNPSFGSLRLRLLLGTAKVINIFIVATMGF